MAQITVEKINYGGWPNCLRITNSNVDIVVTTDIGPRIMRYGFTDSPNMLCEMPDTLGRIGDDEWHIYGGHRLWHSPEAKPRSYSPDNEKVAYKEINNGVQLLQDVEPETRIQKSMEITMNPDNSEVEVKQTLTNLGSWEVELAVWSLTVMCSGGKEVIPQSIRETGLLHNRSISLWSYTKLNDPRVYWGSRYITVQQDVNIIPPFKFGISNEDGWAAYFNHGNMFIKRFEYQADAPYPDNGCSFETYTNNAIIECETLSPLYLIGQGESASHSETWSLFSGIESPPNDDDAIDSIMKSYI